MARGCVKRRAKGSWSIILDLGLRPDPVTGTMKRKQKWFTVRGTRKQAEKRLTDLLGKMDKGYVIEASKLTVGQWLDEWFKTAIEPVKRLRTVETYRSMLSKHIKPALGEIRLCDLRAAHLQAYYEEKQGKLSAKTVEGHHILLSSALKKAVRQQLIGLNPAELVDAKPKPDEGHHDAMAHCWDVEEAAQFAATVQAAGPQPAAFYMLAMETGIRRGELCGLKWVDVDWDATTLSIVRQLIKPASGKGGEPIFGPTKTGRNRTLYLSPKMLTLLRRHKAHQAEVKLQFGSLYKDHGLIFARETGTLGAPLSQNNLGQREYRKLIERAGLRRIKFHGLRHTSATLSLKAGVEAKVVQERLGHKDIGMTLNIYAHCLPEMQQDAAAKVAAVLNGGQA